MFRPGCLPVLIGSLPVHSHAEAVDLILQYTPEIPLWPQLPAHPKEGMVRQFLNGYPGLIDVGKRFWIDVDSPEYANEMTRFYTEYLEIEENPGAQHPARFSLDDESAAGFSVFLKTINQTRLKPITLKGQITGPVTTGTGTKDSNGNSIIYDDNLRDMLVKQLSLKGKWQARTLRGHTSEAPPLVFIDEPAMVSFGSTGFAGISKEMVTDTVSEVIRNIQQGGALAGVHICANGDWTPVLDSKADIISFDAYSYFDNIILFKKELLSFLKRGGLLAWGIIPTADPEVVQSENSDNLFELWLSQVQDIVRLGIKENQLLQQTLISPACGTGSLSLELAIKVLAMNREVATKARAHCQGLTVE